MVHEEDFRCRENCKLTPRSRRPRLAFARRGCSPRALGRGDMGETLVGDRYFFEIAIYRISYDKFTRQYDRDLARHWECFTRASGRTRTEVSGERRMNVDQHFWATYGGPWRFNQAVGGCASSYAVLRFAANPGCQAPSVSSVAHCGSFACLARPSSSTASLNSHPTRFGQRFLLNSKG